MGNFSCFKQEYEALAYFGEAAEQAVYTFPSQSVIAIRSFAEELSKTILAFEGVEEPKKDFNQDKRISLIQKEVDIIPTDIISAFHTLRKAGNKSTHNAAHALTVTGDDAISYLKIAYAIARWFNDVYIFPSYPMVDFVVPPKEHGEVKNFMYMENELKTIKAEYATLLKSIQEKTTSVQEKRQRRKRSQNRRYPEKDARIMIDQQLNESGWETNTDILNHKKNSTMPEKGRNMAIAEWPTKTGYSDYALFIGTKLVGLIEAKPQNTNVSGVLQGQAKEDAKNVVQKGNIELIPMKNSFKVPFIYATNGRGYNEILKEASGIWFFDARYEDSLSYPNNGWHSPDELLTLLSQDRKKADKKLAETSIEKYSLRDYQEKAVKAVENGLANQQTRMLLSMATGTGKTRTALTLMYRLLEAKRFNRLLYIVDRTSLGEQTKDSADALTFYNITFNNTYTFQTIDDTSFDKDAKVRIATIQGLVRKLKDGSLGTVGQYDFIVVDEAHRGYNLDGELPKEVEDYADENEYQSLYKKVIDYFDAYVLALTATPTLSTKEIFGTPIYEYSYEEAVIDGVLVDHDAPIRYNTKLSLEGIKFKESEKVNFLNRKTGQIETRELPDEMKFDVKSFNDRVINEQFNKKIAQYLANDILLSDPGKTLIFARNDMHADTMVRLLKEAYRDNGELVHDDDIVKLTGAVKNHNDRIREFRNEEKPKIVVTVDLLTTGVDVEDIVNLVFMRAIKSRVLYEQMLGRATRKSRNFVKEKFNIYDAVGIYDAMNSVTNMPPVVSTPPSKSLSSLLREIVTTPSDELFYNYKKSFLARVNRILPYLTETQKNELESSLGIPNIQKWIKSHKDKNQEEFDTNYEKLYQLVYYLAHNVDTREVIISSSLDDARESTRGYGEGNQKPEDYIKAFTNFIKNKINEVPALEVAIKNPEKLTKKDLKEIELLLRNKRFTPNDLNIANRDINHVEILSDIIGYIRQAALGTPLESTEFRVKRAMSKIRGKKNWNKRQLKWLDLIEKQLIANIVLGPTAREALDNQFFRNEVGGYKNAIKAFEGENLDELIAEINLALYVS